MAIVKLPPSKTPDERALRSDYAVGDMASVVRTGIIDLIHRTASNNPRSQQTKVGPSEFGHPCPRNVALKLGNHFDNGAPVDSDRSTDPYPAALGTAWHAWLEAAQEADNAVNPGTWEAEQKVTVAEGIFAGCGAGAHLIGSCDCYRPSWRTVVDFKLLGDSQHREYLRGYMSRQYRVQIHGYGYAIKRQGKPVDEVGLAIFNRAKGLRELYVVTEPLNEALVEEHIERTRDLQAVVAGGISPWEVPAVGSKAGCYFCPWSRTCPDSQT